MSDTKPNGETVLGFVVCLAAMTLISIGSCQTDWSLQEQITNLKADVEGYAASPTPTVRDLVSRVRRLESRVLYPRFWQHCKTCANCRGDAKSEEGGPPPLCNEGFELWKEDMREAK